MSLPKKDVRGKIEPDAHAIYATRAAARGESMERIISEVLNEAALGIGYRDRIAAERLMRAGLISKGKED